jgi:predicted secreted Zn-dependent protease
MKQFFRPWPALFLTAFLTLVLSACNSRVTIVEMINEPVSEELYSVTGGSISEVIASIQAGMMSGFTGYGGQRFAAYAGVNIYYDYEVNSSLFGDCRVNKIKVTTRPYMKVPQWKSSGSFEASMLPNWLRYITALRVHEDGHIEIGLAAASSFAAYFTYPNTVKAKNCRELDALVRQIYDTEMAKATQENVDYDKRTGHGKTQGTDAAWN